MKPTLKPISSVVTTPVRRGPSKPKRVGSSRRSAHHYTAVKLSDRDELEKASNRIGRTSKAWMRWLLQFAGQDLSTLSTGGWLNLRYEIALFTIVGPAQAWKLGRYTFASTGMGPMDGPPWYYVVPTREQVKEFQLETQHYLDELIHTHRATFPVLHAELVVFHDAQLDQGVLAVAPEAIETSFLYGLARLLEIHAPRLRRCTTCGARFLASRRRQRFCSPRCQSVFNMRKYRGTPPERIGKPGRPPKDSRPTPKRTQKVRSRALKRRKR